MNGTRLLTASLVIGFGLAAVIGSLAIADSSKDQASAEQPQMQLPPGWTEDDMKDVMIATTPGKKHEFLNKSVGVWRGANTMWMYPDAEPMTNDSTITVTSILGGRFTKMDMAGEIPGMGPYVGQAIFGYDKVSKKFVSTWIDNHSTSIASGIGELSADGKTLVWDYTYNCPITKKPSVMREFERITGPNSRRLEMFGADPKTGKEFKMMSIELERK
jgi:hypothetical protein